MSKHRPTIADVAEKSGLSVSTVSLVLNNKTNVSPQTRSKVQEAIADLKYYPRGNARGLASRVSGNIGFILTEDHFSQSEPFYTKIFLGTEFEARNYNYYVLLTTVGPSVKEEKQIPRFLLEHNVDGVIIAGRIGSSWLEEINERGLPMVLVDFDSPRHNVSLVGMDNHSGARLAVQHLCREGHTKIGFIGGDIKHPSIAARLAGFREECKFQKVECRREWESIDEHGTGVENGARAARKLFLNRNQIPTAVFAANDAMAIGCIQFVKSQKLSVPKDIAVVGFDNIEAGLHVDPRLTTVNVQKEELGALAVRRLVEMIKSETPAVTRTFTPVELIVRESCGAKNGVHHVD
ncbi:MAG: LacI family DNA-binding transcriptional regulator [Ignavibacteriales bacterium]|nr:LacI family DNA-binding transcriptional regulator [Ignavibacteriales bacterium]